MASWCMAHPWMTFFIAIWGISALDNVFVAIANAIIIAKKHKKQDGDSHEEEA